MLFFDSPHTPVVARVIPRLKYELPLLYPPYLISRLISIFLEICTVTLAITAIYRNN